MSPVEGTLYITKDQHIRFQSRGIGGPSFDGTYAPALEHDIEKSATIDFGGERGPYDFDGFVGDRGIKLQFRGPVGHGELTGGPVGIVSKEIQGSVNYSPYVGPE